MVPRRVCEAHEAAGMRAAPAAPNRTRMHARKITVVFCMHSLLSLSLRRPSRSSSTFAHNASARGAARCAAASPPYKTNRAGRLLLLVVVVVASIVPTRCQSFSPPITVWIGLVCQLGAVGVAAAVEEAMATEAAVVFQGEVI